MTRQQAEYQDYLSSEDWQRKSCFLKDTIQECELCGSTRNLQVHHISYQKNGISLLGSESVDDLLVVCNKCHKLIHKYKKVEKEGPQREIPLRTYGLKWDGDYYTTPGLILRFLDNNGDGPCYGVNPCGDLYSINFDQLVDFYKGYFRDGENFGFGFICDTETNMDSIYYVNDHEARYVWNRLRNKLGASYSLKLSKQNKWYIEGFKQHKKTEVEAEIAETYKWSLHSDSDIF